jgi:hypothetical protein
MWAPVFSNDDKSGSLLIVSLQPGFRVKLLNDQLFLSGGISTNPVFPFPFGWDEFWIGIVSWCKCENQGYGVRSIWNSYV